MSNLTYSTTQLLTEPDLPEWAEKHPLQIRLFPECNLYSVELRSLIVFGHFREHGTPINRVEKLDRAKAINYVNRHAGIDAIKGVRMYGGSDRLPRGIKLPPLSKRNLDRIEKEWEATL